MSGEGQRKVQRPPQRAWNHRMTRWCTAIVAGQKVTVSSQLARMHSAAYDPSEATEKMGEMAVPRKEMAVVSEVARTTEAVCA